MQKKDRDLTTKETRGIYQSVRLCWEKCGFDSQDFNLSAEADN